ncbi:MAG: hypothetical protein H0X41_14340 [Chitinophagaceae bacterium]|nr:hypothetical protein [Chitinophagaceae bacterium]
MANKTTLVLDAVRWLLRHRSVSHSIWCTLILLEVVFAAGFLTFKWDRMLLVCYLLFLPVGG